MKRTHKLPALLLAMLMLVSLTLTGCQKKEAPVPAEDVAMVLFDMMLKNDAASAMELFGYSSEEEAREDMGMDGDFYGELADEMVSQFEDMGATVSNEDVQACVDAFISMFEHVEFQAKLKEADEEAGTAVVTCTISTFDPEAINNAVNDVITELMSSPEIIESEDVDALYSLILAKMAETYASITPTGETADFDVDFELDVLTINGKNREVWLPVDAEAFGAAISSTAMGM